MTKISRLIVVLVLMAIGAAFIWPTINWYFIVPENVKQVASGSRESIRTHAQEKALVAIQELKALVTSSPDAPMPASYAYVQDHAASLYRDAGKATPAAWTVKSVLDAFGSAEAVETVVEDKLRQDILAIKNTGTRIIQLGLDLKGGMSVVIQADRAGLDKRLGKAVTDAEYSEAMDQTIEQLKSRIDQFGVSEPSVRKDIGANRILIEIPGYNDPERVNQFLMGGGNLALQIVDDEATQKLMEYQAKYKSEHDAQPWDPSKETPADLIPAGTQARAYKQKDKYGIDYTVRYIVTKESSDTTVDGNSITEAQVARDNLTGAPTVNFVMNSEGGKKFGQITRDNKGKSMAIVLADNVRAYARISEEIPNGQVRLTGFAQEEAMAISKVLKTGALKLDLKVESVQAVGASLGDDAVRSGIMAIAVGFGLVFLFMLIYYLGCGVIADIALIAKLYFMFAILAVFNLTLTMTSIAGLILTVGIAVDANVIIFERIKDELRSGKARAAAVAGGYKKAFWTIIDSNITNLIAAILMAYLGTGPIQGFAVTLMAGIVTSLFSALFVSRLIQDFETEQLGHTKMSIAWRLK